MENRGSSTRDGEAMYTLDDSREFQQEYRGH